MLRSRSLIALSISVALLGGCEGRSQPTTPAPAAAPDKAPTPSSAAPAEPLVVPVSNAAPPAVTDAPTGALVGTILETMDAGTYTYMRLQTAGGEIWAAVPKVAVKTGQVVAIAGPVPMDGFESPTLHRKFDHIVFGALGSAPASVPDAGQPAGKPLGMERATDVGKVDVTKAEGPDALTVAEVYERRAKLSGKTVSVRGKVVKVVRGVMGKNFFHVRDGSGSSAKEDDDLTITSAGDANVGDVVLVRGTIQADRDFGAGYAYKVIVEEATLTTR